MYLSSSDAVVVEYPYSSDFTNWQCSRIELFSNVRGPRSHDSASKSFMGSRAVSHIRSVRETYVGIIASEGWSLKASVSTLLSIIS